MNKKGGLGRGLGSLIPNNKQNIFTADNTTFNNEEKKVIDFNVPKEIEQETAGQLISEILLSNIVPNSHQPRHYFDEKALEDLSNSIKKNGILQPIIVNQIAQNKFEIIAGERRSLAAKKAGLETIPVIIRKVKDQQKLELAIIENVQRENLNAIEEAKGYFRLNNEFDLTHEQIADQVGKSRSQITNLIRLLDLPELIQEAIIKNQISVGHAKMITSLETEEEQLKLFNSIITKHLNVRETERTVNLKKIKSSKFTNQSIKNPNTIEKEELLREALGTKVNITQRGGRGKIEIEYHSNEDLYGLIEKIIKGNTISNLPLHF